MIKDSFNNNTKERTQMKLNIYSEVEKAGLILPRKAKYTKRDVTKLIIDSLFWDKGRTITEKEAVFVVKCSAAKHDSELSKWVWEWMPQGQILRNSL